VRVCGWWLCGVCCLAWSSWSPRLLLRGVFIHHRISESQHDHLTHAPLHNHKYKPQARQAATTVSSIVLAAGWSAWLPGGGVKGPVSPRNSPRRTCFELSALLLLCPPGATYTHNTGRMAPVSDKAKGRVLLPKNVVPLKYDLTFDVDLEK